MVQQPAPHGHATCGSDQVRGPGVGLLQCRHEIAEQVLQHEAPRTGAGIDGSEDEQCLEENCKVVPERHGVLTWQRLVEDLGNPHGQGRRSTGARQDGVLANVGGSLLQDLRRYGEAPAAHGSRHGRDIATHHGGRAVHGEVDPRFDDRCRDNGHDRDKGLHQHRAVADVTGMTFIGQQLGCGTRADQRVEARHRAASHGNEQEGEQGALPDRARAIDEVGNGWHFQVGGDDQDADCQGDDGPDLEEGRKVVPWRQDQPDGQYRGNEAIADEHPGNLQPGEGERRPPDWVGGDQATAPDGRQQQDHADHGDLTDTPWAQVAHVDAHEHCNRQRGHYREHAPGALRQRLDHDQRQHREDDDHDQEGTEQGDGTGDGAHFFAYQFAQGATIATGGDEQHHEVLDSTRQDHTGDQPERAGQVAHLCCEHRANQRARAGNGSKVVPEENVLVGRYVVQAVVVEYGGRGACGVQLHHLVGDEQAVVTVGNEVDGNCCGHDPEGVDGFAPA
ncbi:hypothetical protein D3C81_1075110 [compost metagenome]